MSYIVSSSLPRLLSIESIISSSYLIHCCPLLLLLLVFPSIRVFFSELAVHIRWQKYWSFSFSISPSYEYSELISLGLTHLISLLSKELSRVFSSTSLKTSTLRCAAFFMVQLSHPRDYWKNHSFDYMDLCGQSYVSAF